MPNVVIVGTQWGDEGKGKVVDVLSPLMAAVIRFQGGNNAGHTLVVEGEQMVLHLLPSGMLRPDCTCVIGNGVVIDPTVLLRELDELRAKGHQVDGNKLASAFTSRSTVMTRSGAAISRALAPET